MKEMVDARDVRYAMTRRHQLQAERDRWSEVVDLASRNIKRACDGIEVQDAVVRIYVEQEAEHGRRHQSIAKELGMDVKAVSLIVRRYRDRLRREQQP